MQKQNKIASKTRSILQILSISLITVMLFSTKIYAQTPPQTQSTFAVETVYFRSNPVIQYIPNRIYVIIDSRIDFEGKITISYMENDQKIALTTDAPFLVIGKRSVGLFTDKAFNTSGDKDLIIELKDSNGNIVSTGLTSKVTVEADNDGDGIPNSIDADDDNDGILDSNEIKVGTDPFNVDTDNDGVSDSTDQYPLDPTRPGAKTNSLSNTKANSGTILGTTTNTNSESQTPNQSPNQNQNPTPTTTTELSNSNQESQNKNSTSTNNTETPTRNWFEQLFNINPPTTNPNPNSNPNASSGNSSQNTNSQTSNKTDSTEKTADNRSDSNKAKKNDYTIYYIIIGITTVTILVIAYRKKYKKEN